MKKKQEAPEFLPRRGANQFQRKPISSARRPKKVAYSPMLCLCFALALVQGPLLCKSHNWLNNPASRASKTSTTSPCPPADLTPPAHMQVGPNQEFKVEFMSGHSAASYFAISERGRKQLKFHGQNMFEKYIAQAPEVTVPAPERTHVGCHKVHPYSGCRRLLTTTILSTLKGRARSFKNIGRGTETIKYTDSISKHDVFTSYRITWPWLEGVYRFNRGQSFPPRRV